MVTPLGVWLREHYELTRALTFATLAVEAVGPALLFIPYRQDAIRLAVVVLFVSFHLFGLGLFMYLGIFPYVSAISWLALIPGSFWNRFQRQSPTPKAQASSNLDDSTYLPWFLNCIAGFFLVYVLLWNLRTTNFERYKAFLPESMNPIGFSFGVDQYWSMFARAQCGATAGISPWER